MLVQGDQHPLLKTLTVGGWSVKTVLQLRTAEFENLRFIPNEI